MASQKATKRIVMCDATSVNTTIIAKCGDVVHFWPREYFWRHFESSLLQAAKLRIAKSKSKKGGSSQPEKLSEDLKKELKTSLGEAKVYIKTKREFIKYTGEKCDSNRECRERQKHPCIFSTKHQEESKMIKNVIHADEASEELLAS